MRFLISPCAYKGTLTALQLCQSMQQGVFDALPDACVTLAPIADGGDGTLDALHIAVGGTFHFVDTIDAIGRPVKAKWLSLGENAVIELACTSGLALLQKDNALDALSAHTYGLGEVARHALSTHPKKLYVCVGGSASTDGGAGMLRAMGAKFFNESGELVELGGEALLRLQRCDLSAVQNVVTSSGVESIYVAVDVDNPLLGDSGAAAVYGPQKGADKLAVARLDKALTRFADVLEIAAARVARDLPGAGAAGGTAFGINLALGAELISGFKWMASIIDLEAKIRDCDVIITGEGCLDSQSLSGKAVGELAKLAALYGKQLWAVPAIAATDLDWQSYGVHKLMPSSAHGKLADQSSVQAAVYELISS